MARLKEAWVTADQRWCVVVTDDQGTSVLAVRPTLREAWIAAEKVLTK